MFTGYVAQRYYTPYYESQPGSWLVLFCERSENRGSGGVAVKRAENGVNRWCFRTAQSNVALILTRLKSCDFSCLSLMFGKRNMFCFCNSCQFAFPCTMPRPNCQRVPIFLEPHRGSTGASLNLGGLPARSEPSESMVKYAMELRK